MSNSKILFPIAVVCLLLCSCSKDEHFASDLGKLDPILLDYSLGWVDGYHNDNYYRIKNFYLYDEPRPLIIAIHGGGFTGGSYKDMEPNVFNSNKGWQWIDDDWITGSGIAYATINYKLVSPPDCLIHHSLYDIKEMVRFFIEEGAELYNIDPEKVILLGVSAGASASLWIGFNDYFKKNIKGIVCFNPQGSLDMSMWWSSIGMQSDCSYVDFNRHMNGKSNHIKKVYGTSDMMQIKRLSDFHGLHYLNNIDSDDPDVLINVTVNNFYHNEYHANAILRKSKEAGHNAKLSYVSKKWLDYDYEGVAGFCIMKFERYKDYEYLMPF